MGMDYVCKTPSPPSSPDATESGSRGHFCDVKEEVFDDNDRVRLLGERGGKQVKWIIDSDRDLTVGRGVDGDETYETLGYPFWNDENGSMDVDDVGILQFMGGDAEPKAVFGLLESYTTQQSTYFFFFYPSIRLIPQ